MKNDPNIVVATFDLSTNDPPQGFLAKLCVCHKLLGICRCSPFLTVVHSFPTIFWLRMGEKNNHVEFKVWCKLS